MATLGEYFENEARHSLAQLERQLAAPAGPDVAEVYSAIRGLRGAAQMAREEFVRRGAGMFEAAGRALVDGTIGWSPDTAERARATIDDLHALIQAQDDDAQREARLARIAERWRSAGVEAQQRRPGATAGTGATAAPGAERPAGSGADGGAQEFRTFVAREVAAVADALEAGVKQLLANPMDREPLRVILQRQRVLLGASRLDEVPIIGEILRAVDDLTRVIAKLNVGAKNEWLDIYRVAFEALRATIAPLDAGVDLHETHAVRRLRHMRAELIERYGTGEAVSAVHEDAGLVQAMPFEQAPAPAAHFERPPVPAAPGRAEETSFAGVAPFTPPPAAAAPGDVLEVGDVIESGDVLDLGDELIVATPAPPAHDDDTHAAGTQHGARPADAGDDVVAIDQLEYRGDAAIRRARELRDVIAATASADPRAIEAADELLDLVRLNAE
jgi:hypothetical protein